MDRELYILEEHLVAYRRALDLLRYATDILNDSPPDTPENTAAAVYHARAEREKNEAGERFRSAGGIKRLRELQAEVA